MSQPNDPFVPPPPPAPSIGNPMYPPDVLEAKAKEASDDLRTGLIFAIIGLICFGIIFGILAYRRANNAREIMKIYGVIPEKSTMATVVLVLGIIDIVGFFVFMGSRLFLMSR